MCLAPSEIKSSSSASSHFGCGARKTSKGKKPSPLLGPTQLLPLSLTLSHSCAKNQFSVECQKHIVEL